MHNDRALPQEQNEPVDSSPVGEIELGAPPAIGRRARALAGLVTGATAAVMVTANFADTVIGPGTTFTAP